MSEVPSGVLLRAPHLVGGRPAAFPMRDFEALPIERRRARRNPSFTDIWRCLTRGRGERG